MGGAFANVKLDVRFEPYYLFVEILFGNLLTAVIRPRVLKEQVTLSSG